jgi:hypothetical protein
MAGSARFLIARVLPHPCSEAARRDCSRVGFPGRSHPCAGVTGNHTLLTAGLPRRRRTLPVTATTNWAPWPFRGRSSQRSIGRSWSAWVPQWCGQPMHRTRTLVKKSCLLNEWHSSRRCLVATGLRWMAAGARFRHSLRQPTRTRSLSEYANRRLAENKISMHAPLERLCRNQHAEWRALANHILRTCAQTD